MTDPTDSELTVRVDFDGHGGWEIDIDEAQITCQSLSDARRLAFSQAARLRPCEIVVRDAYHRVIERRHLETVAGASSEG